MNTQNTPVHIKLWHRDFWLMAIANFLVSISVYIFLPVLPLWMLGSEHFSMTEVGLSMGVLGIGMFGLGGFCSYLVQRFRRNVVCMVSISAMCLCILFIYYVETLHYELLEFWVITADRFFLGASFGLSRMILASTLIIDTSESFRRTEANHSAAWFARFALPIGPLAGVLANSYLGFDAVVLISAFCCVSAIFLIKMVSFPFRAPEDNVKLFCLDRFFLPQGMVLFVNLVLITVSVGLLFSMKLPFVFYAIMVAGFLLALLAQRYVFQNAELKSEVVTGLILMGASIMAMLTFSPAASYIAPLLIGLGIGIIGSRYLLFFIKLSRHCQRGTSQSTYILGWQLGVSVGLFLGYSVFLQSQQCVLVCALAFTALSLIVYNFIAHDWFMRNKNR